MTPRCAQSMKRCTSPNDRATIPRSALAKYALGIALLQRDAAADRQRGMELMAQVRDVCLHGRVLPLVPVADAVDRTGDGQAGRPRWCHTGDSEVLTITSSQDSSGTSSACTAVLVETLLARGAEGDLAETQSAIDWVARLPADEGLAMRDLTCCGCAPCWPAPAATTLPTASWRIAIALWRNRLASKDTSRWARR